MSLNSHGSVSEADCGATDIRDNMSPPMREHFSTPRNQSTIGWCYAFTASDLLSAEVGTPVSATYTAAVYNQAIQRNPLARGFFAIANTLSQTPTNSDISVREGGFVRQAVRVGMRQEYLCSEEGLPFNSAAQRGTVEHIQFLEQLGEYIRDNRSGPINLSNCPGFAHQREINPFLSGDLQTFAQELANNQINESFANIARTNCPRQHRIPVGQNRVLKRNNPMQGQGSRSPADADRWLREINNVLNSGKPLGLEYDAGALAEKSGTLAHASIIMARKWENGKCLFKVRNSWGQSCDEYAPSRISGCNESEGAFWISDELLLEVSTNVNYINSQSP